MNLLLISFLIIFLIIVLLLPLTEWVDFFSQSTSQNPPSTPPSTPPPSTPPPSTPPEDQFFVGGDFTPPNNWNLLSGTSNYYKNNIMESENSIFEAGVVSTSSSFSYPNVPSLAPNSSDTKLVTMFKNHIFTVSTKDYLFFAPKASLYNSITSSLVTVSDVRVIVGSNYLIDKPRINLAIYGKSKENYIEFISDINFHEKIRLQAVMLTNKKEFVTLTFIPIFNEVTNVSTTIIKLNKGDSTSERNITLAPNTEFYIFTSYNIHGGVNGDCESSGCDGDYYCR